MPITEKLEPSIRSLSSPSNNFIWGSSKIARVVLGAGPPIAGTTIEVLRITLIHNDADHDGNVVASTEDMAMSPRSTSSESTCAADGAAVWTVDDVQDALRKTLRDEVREFWVVDERKSTLVALSHKEEFPNGLGDKGRFPDPWTSEEASSQ